MVICIRDITKIAIAVTAIPNQQILGPCQKAQSNRYRIVIWSLREHRDVNTLTPRPLVSIPIQTGDVTHRHDSRKD